MLNLKKIIKESFDLLLAGGTSRHMAHLFEDPDLTFKQLKDIFTKLFKGNISISEKTDGQSLSITFKDGEIKAAKNKATLKNPVSIKDVEKMFEGKAEVKNAFIKSMKDISSAIKTIDDTAKKTIFNNGQNFVVFEIIYPPAKNIVDYGNRCIIQLQAINIYDEKWHKIREDKELLDKFYAILKQKNALKQETFEITDNIKLKLKDTKSGEESLKIILDKLTALADGLGWNATINDYATERFEKYIINMAMKADFELNKRSEFVTKLADRLSNISKKNVTKNDLAAYAKSEGIDIKNQKFRDFVNSIDETKDEANQYVIKPLEDLVINAGLLLMKNLVGYISSDHKNSAKRLAAELDDTIKELNSKEASLDDVKLRKFKKNLAKLDQYQREINGSEGIVFSYKGKAYKMTTTFGAVNQLMEILKY